MVKAVVLDFGGVLAGEGFREGLKAIARMNGLDPEEFFLLARNLIYDSGYVTGKTDERRYWEAVRLKTKIKNGDNELRNEILKRFVLRPSMLDEIKRIRAAGVTVALLSDQTDWLDQVNHETPFYPCFDHIFNSFYLKKSKRDVTLFDDVARQLGVKPQEILFVDDTGENLERAHSRGWKTLHFTSVEEFKRAIKEENI